MPNNFEITTYTGQRNGLDMKMFSLYAQFAAKCDLDLHASK